MVLRKEYTYCFPNLNLHILLYTDQRAVKGSNCHKIAGHAYYAIVGYIDLEKNKMFDYC